MDKKISVIIRLVSVITILSIFPLMGCATLKEFELSRAPLIFADNPVEENMAGKLQHAASSVMVQVCVGEGTGSGILWETTDKHLVIVTAAHVVEPGGGIAEVKFVDGTIVSVAECKMTDKDLAFLYVKLEEIPDATMDFLYLPNLPVSGEDTLKKNAGIIVMGSADGVASNAYEGTVLETWIYVEDFGQHMILLNADVLPGMSGGGVFDYWGVLQGILCGADEEGGAVALPISVVEAEYEVFR